MKNRGDIATVDQQGNFDLCGFKAHCYCYYRPNAGNYYQLEVGETKTVFYVSNYDGRCDSRYKNVELPDGTSAALYFFSDYPIRLRLVEPPRKREDWEKVADLVYNH